MKEQQELLATEASLQPHPLLLPGFLKSARFVKKSYPLDEGKAHLWKPEGGDIDDTRYGHSTPIKKCCLVCWVIFCGD